MKLGIGVSATLAAVVPLVVNAQAPVEMEEVYRAGGLDLPNGFIHLVHVAVDDDGWAYALDRLAARVKLISPSGDFAASLGHEGEGPGEFRRPGRLGLLGDSIWVLDQAGRRVTFLSEDGAVRSSQMVTLPASTTDGFLWTARWLSRAGDIIAFPVFPARDQADGLLPTSLRLRRVTRKGEEAPLDAPPVWTGRPSMVLESPGGGHRTLAYQPFNDGTLWSASPDGRFLLLVSRRVESEMKSPVATVIDLDGWQSNAWEVPQVSAERIDSAMIDRAVEGAREILPAAMQTDLSDNDYKEALYVPRMRFPLETALVGNQGTVWIRAEDRAGGRWLVFSREGKLERQVRSPNIDGMAVTATCLWGADRDNLNLQYLVAYRLPGADSC